MIAAMREGSIAQILANGALWPCDLTDMLTEVTACMGKIEELGAKGAMEWILSE
jgi:hypothetical protein